MELHFFFCSWPMPMPKPARRYPCARYANVYDWVYRQMTAARTPPRVALRNAVRRLLRAYTAKPQRHAIALHLNTMVTSQRLMSKHASHLRASIRREASKGIAALEAAACRLQRAWRARMYHPSHSWHVRSFEASFEADGFVRCYSPPSSRSGSAVAPALSGSGGFSSTISIPPDASAAGTSDVKMVGRNADRRL